jgi:CheY-like chemotaxis protein
MLPKFSPHTELDREKGRVSSDDNSPFYCLRFNHNDLTPDEQQRTVRGPSFTRALSSMATLSRQSHDRTDSAPPRWQATNVKPLVLVVEDHDDTSFMLRYLLEMQGCRVATAQDGLTAVRLAEQTRPDLILMDTSLPRLDGLAATRRIRELAALHEVPIVFLSGHAEASFRAVALETGGNDYLVKPFALDQLQRVIERHLVQSATEKAE